VSIKPSSTREIQTLIADLSGGSDVKRDAAVARLTIIGARAVERLAALALSEAPSATRVAALRALDGIGDDRMFDVVMRAIAVQDLDVVVAAIGAARRLLQLPRGMAVIDRLTAVSLDRTRSDKVRAAAIRALSELKPATLAPLMQSLAGDPSSAVRGAAQATSARQPIGIANNPIAALTRVAQDTLPDDAVVLRRLIARGERGTPLPVLARLIERIREREGEERGVRREEWAAARASAHLALARRGSRMALYDLKESLEKQAAPLPVDALAALSLIGDASCLAAMASSYARSKDRWWKDHLREVFGTVVKRERLTKRHAAVRALERKSPGLVSALWPAKAPSTKP
jgi:HEAT repeat protein